MMGDAGGRGMEEEEEAGRRPQCDSEGCSPLSAAGRGFTGKEKKDPGEAKEQKLLRHERV